MLEKLQKLFEAARAAKEVGASVQSLAIILESPRPQLDVELTSFLDGSDLNFGLHRDRRDKFAHAASIHEGGEPSYSWTLTLFL